MKAKHRTTVTLYEEDQQRLERLKERLRQQTSGIVRLALLELERKIERENHEWAQDEAT